GQGQIPEKRDPVVHHGTGREDRHVTHRSGGEALMAVTRAEKEVELQALESAFQGAQTAVLVDYKGLNVPQVTELRRQLRATKSTYKVIKNTLAKRAVKGTPFEELTAH